mmetsp:Transcript_38375/g.116067  ORF Transcript_38375/g.116067 Transcript_38375/m.116067 type:complete len:260 (-) Transcript_38375:3-782(-)
MKLRTEKSTVSGVGHAACGEGMPAAVTKKPNIPCVISWIELTSGAKPANAAAVTSANRNLPPKTEPALRSSAESRRPRARSTFGTGGRWSIAAPVPSGSPISYIAPSNVMRTGPYLEDNVISGSPGSRLIKAAATPRVEWPDNNGISFPVGLNTRYDLALVSTKLVEGCNVSIATLLIQASLASSPAGRKHTHVGLPLYAASVNTSTTWKSAAALAPILRGRPETPARGAATTDRWSMLANMLEADLQIMRLREGCRAV